ncbi:MAG: UxaA family hydrolase [Peptococcaceae bacterium]|jgi:altronate dehydratase small subunit|nr:UxaA family hydrolase [Peptococcaceae bacterium]MDH7525392.1 UxaA family hydrolase [Peptococcaceae bacterium]
MKKAIVMEDIDNVATALEAVAAGEVIQLLSRKNEDIGQLKAIESIPFGYKVAITEIAGDDFVIKYGAKIGKALITIKQGELVHVHNVVSMRVVLPETVKREVLAEINYKKI